MTNVQVIPFEPCHINLDCVREHERQMFLEVFANHNHIFESFAKRGRAWTIVINDEVITCSGLYPMWPGVYEGWQVPTIRVQNNSYQYAKAYKETLDDAFMGDEVHRVQSYCIHDDLHDKWMRFLGFEKEGVMRKYSWDKRDYALYARVK